MASLLVAGPARAEDAPAPPPPSQEAPVPPRDRVLESRDPGALGAYLLRNPEAMAGLPREFWKAHPERLAELWKAVNSKDFPIKGPYTPEQEKLFKTLGDFHKDLVESPEAEGDGAAEGDGPEADEESAAAPAGGKIKDSVNPETVQKGVLDPKRGTFAPLDPAAGEMPGSRAPHPPSGGGRVLPERVAPPAGFTAFAPAPPMPGAPGVSPAQLQAAGLGHYAHALGPGRNPEGYLADFEGLTPFEQAEYFVRTGNLDAAHLFDRLGQSQRGGRALGPAEQARLRSWLDFPRPQERAAADLQYRDELFKAGQRPPLSAAEQAALGQAVSGRRSPRAAQDDEARRGVSAVEERNRRAEEEARDDDLVRRAKGGERLSDDELARLAPVLAGKDAKAADIVRRGLKPGDEEGAARLAFLKAFSFDRARLELWERKVSGGEPLTADEERTLLGVMAGAVRRLDRLAEKPEEDSGSAKDLRFMLAAYAAQRREDVRSRLEELGRLPNLVQREYETVRLRLEDIDLIEGHKARQEARKHLDWQVGGANRHVTSVALFEAMGMRDVERPAAAFAKAEEVRLRAEEAVGRPAAALRERLAGLEAARAAAHRDGTLDRWLADFDRGSRAALWEELRALAKAEAGMREEARRSLDAGNAGRIRRESYQWLSRDLSRQVSGAFAGLRGLDDRGALVADFRQKFALAVAPLVPLEGEVREAAKDRIRTKAQVKELADRIDKALGAEAFDKALVPLIAQIRKSDAYRSLDLKAALQKPGYIPADVPGGLVHLEKAARERAVAQDAELKTLLASLEELVKDREKVRDGLRAGIRSEEEKMELSLGELSRQFAFLSEVAANASGERRFLGQPAYNLPEATLPVRVPGPGRYGIGSGADHVRFEVDGAFRLHYLDERGERLPDRAPVEPWNRAKALNNLNELWNGDNAVGYVRDLFGADRGNAHTPKVAAQFTASAAVLGELEGLRKKGDFDGFVKKAKASLIYEKMDPRHAEKLGKLSLIGNLEEYRKNQEALIAGYLNTVQLLASLPAGGGIRLAGLSALQKVGVISGMMTAGAVTQITVDAVARPAYAGTAGEDRKFNAGRSAMNGAIFYGAMGPLGELNGWWMTKLAANSRTLNALGVTVAKDASGAMMVQGTNAYARFTLGMSQSMLAAYGVGPTQRFLDEAIFNAKSLPEAFAAATKGENLLHDAVMGAGFGLFHFAAGEGALMKLRADRRAALRELGVDAKGGDLTAERVLGALNERKLGVVKDAVAAKRGLTPAERASLDALDRAALEVFGVTKESAQKQVEELAALKTRTAEQDAALSSWRRSRELLGPPERGRVSALEAIDAAAPGTRVNADRLIEALKGELVLRGVPVDRLPAFEKVRAETSENVFEFDFNKNVVFIAENKLGQTNFGRAKHEAEHAFDLFSKKFTRAEFTDAAAKAEAVRRAAGDVERPGFMTPDQAASALAAARKAYRAAPAEVSADTARWLAERHRLETRLAGVEAAAARSYGADPAAWPGRVAKALDGGRARLEEYGRKLADLDLQRLINGIGGRSRTEAGPASRLGSLEAPGTGTQTAGRLAAVKQSMGDLVSQLFGRRLGAANAVRGPGRPIERLEDVGALPADPAARSKQVGELVKGYMGLTGVVEVGAPATPPGSGDQVFVIRQDGGVVAVAKVFVARDPALTLAQSLGGGEAVGRLGLGKSKPVGAHGAFRAGPTETLFIMEAAPGRDLYEALRAVGRAAGPEQRSLALAEAQADVAAVAEAVGELHRVSRSPGAGPKNIAYDVNSAGKMLRGIKDGLPVDVYNGMQVQLDRLGAAVRQGRGPGALTHGDANPGNFFVKGGAVTLIDLETAVHSLGPKGQGAGNPAADVGRFLESMRLNDRTKGLNLTANERRSLERAFVESYAREAGVSAADLQLDVDFYRLRLTMAAMKHDPANMERYVDSARALLAELKSSK